MHSRDVSLQKYRESFAYASLGKKEIGKQLQYKDMELSRINDFL